MNEWDGRSMESLTVVHESKLGAPLYLSLAFHIWSEEGWNERVGKERCHVDVAA